MFAEYLEGFTRKSNLPLLLNKHLVLHKTIHFLCNRIVFLHKKHYLCTRETSQRKYEDSYSKPKERT